LDHLPFADGSFDLVSCNMVVEHLRTPAKTFQELTRVLAPGGHLVIHTPNALSYVVFAGRIAKAVLPREWIYKLILWSEFRKSEDVFPTFYRANSKRRIKNLLSQAGLRETSSQLLVGPHPIFWRFAPIASLELLLQRLSLVAPFHFLRSALLVVYQKPFASEDVPSKRAEAVQEQVRIA
jgi:SAM-dependent methyltransferase